MPLKITGLFKSRLTTPYIRKVITTHKLRGGLSDRFREKSSVCLLDVFDEAVRVFHADNPWNDRSQGTSEEEEYKT